MIFLKRISLFLMILACFVNVIFILTSKKSNDTIQYIFTLICNLTVAFYIFMSSPI